MTLGATKENGRIHEEAPVSLAAPSGRARARGYVIC